MRSEIPVRAFEAPVALPPFRPSMAAAFLIASSSRMGQSWATACLSQSAFLNGFDL
jgi:hypothetical protein